MVTRNHYLTAEKAFCRWLEREGRLPDNPLKHVSKRKEAAHIRYERRALSLDECRRLLKATRENGHHHGIDAEDRALLYHLTLETGLRWAEALSLKARHVALEGDPPTICVEAAYSKSGREDRLPLPEKIAEKMADHIRYRMPEAPQLTPKLTQNLGQLWVNPTHRETNPGKPPKRKIALRVSLKGKIGEKKWYARQDLNLRPAV